VQLFVISSAAISNFPLHRINGGVEVVQNQVASIAAAGLLLFLL
jgi:hypothetical protein